MKCAKRPGFLEFSYARIACGSPIENEYIFIITSRENTPVGAVRGLGSQPA
jgi:hypothetical protein